MKRIGIALALLIVLMLPAVSNAEISVSGCSTLDVTGETYILTEDIIDSGASVCMDIKANDVTLDCQGHRIDGIDKSLSKGVYKYPGNGRNATIKNCVISDWDAGIYLIYADGATVTENRVESSSIAIRVTSSPGSVVSKNEVTEFFEAGIWLIRTDNITVSSNKITGPTDGYRGPGINMTSYGKNLLIEDNEITEANWGIYFYVLIEGGGNVISRNTIRNSKQQPWGGPSGGIFVLDPKGAEIKNNVIENCGGYGISVSGLHFTISNNEASGNYEGISVSWPWEGGGSTFSTVQDNIVHDNMKGIWFRSNQNIMSNNSVYRNVTGISVLDAHNNEIRNNRVYENDNGASIHSSLNTVFEGNTVTENKYSGVQLSAGGGLILTGNKVCGNGDYDIYVYPNTPPADYSGSENRCQTVLGWHDDAIKEGCTFKCLNNPPDAEAGPDQTVECSGSGASVRLDGSGSTDPDNDPLRYTWIWQGGTVEGVSPTITVPLGTTKATLTVDDGNGGKGSDTVFVTVRDTTPPLTTYSIISIPGDNGWYRSDVLIAVESTDICSGVREIRSIVDGTAATTAGSTAAISVRGDMVHSVSFHAADNAGSIEQPKTLTVKIDQTPPAITAVVNPEPNTNGWNNTDVTVTFTCSDSTSGIASCPDPVTVATEGAGQVITREAVDKAGNTATTSITLNIDKTPPSIPSLSASPSILWPPDHKMVDVLVGGTAADSGSGIASTVITVSDEYGIYNMTVPGFGSAIQLESWRKGTDMDGRLYTITAVTTDKAGNQSTGTTTVLVPHDMR